MLCGHCKFWFAGLVAKATQVTFPCEYPQWKTEEVSIQFRTLRASYKSCLVCIKLLFLLYVPSSAEVTVEDAVEEILSIWTEKSLANVSPDFTFKYLQTDSNEGAEMVLTANVAGAVREWRFKAKDFPTRRHYQLELHLDDGGRHHLAASEHSSESLSAQLWPSAYSTVAKHLDFADHNGSNDVGNGIFVRLLPGISEPGLGEAGLGPTSDVLVYHSSWIKQKIKECQKYHVLCTALYNEARTVDIESAADRLLKIDFEKSFINLVETTKGMSEELRGKYITFTHCSGTDPRLVLGPGYSRGAEAKLPFRNLPLLLRNVMTLCQDLGVHYIWVDSLCVVHDELDPSDWDAQSAKIHNIYGNSLINVSWGSTAGMPLGYLRAEGNQAHLRLDVHINEIFVLSEVPCAPSSLSRAVPPFHRPELRARKFVLQELFLSHKAVHFGSDKRHWQCPTHNDNAMNTWFGYYQLRQLGYNSAIRADRSWITAFSPHNQLTEVQLDMLWEVVLNYCCDNIDPTSGQGAAEFSSYAMAIEQQYQHLCHANLTSIPQASYRYVHGCWMQNMCRWLLWHPARSSWWPEKPRKYKDRDAKSEAFPTWSWLSYYHNVNDICWKGHFPSVWLHDGEHATRWKDHFERKYGRGNSRATFDTFDTERLSQASTIQGDFDCTALRITAPAFSLTLGPRYAYRQWPKPAPSRRSCDPPLSFISYDAEMYDIEVYRPAFNFRFALDDEERYRPASCIRPEDITTHCAAGSLSTNTSSEQDVLLQREFQCIVLKADWKPDQACLEGLILSAIDMTGKFYRRAGVFTISYGCEGAKVKKLYSGNNPITELQSRSEEKRLLALLLRCEKGELVEFRVV